MIDFNHMIKEYGKYESQTHVGGRTIPEADGLLTGDKKPISELYLHQPLIPLPPVKLTKNQIMCLYD